MNHRTLLNIATVMLVLSVSQRPALAENDQSSTYTDDMSSYHQGWADWYGDMRDNSSEQGSEEWSDYYEHGRQTEQENADWYGNSGSSAEE